MLSALQAQQAKENNLDSVDEREEREETNRRRRLQREKAKRREEKGEKARQRGKSENNEATSRREETANEEVEEVEGGCSHCRGSVATECVYLCQKGHLHRDLPGEGCHHCGRRGESQCKSAFMRILRAGGQSSSKGSSRASSAANISS